jgi:hypothetical protein
MIETRAESCLIFQEQVARSCGCMRVVLILLFHTNILGFFFNWHVVVVSDKLWESRSVFACDDCVMLSYLKDELGF